MAKQQMMIRIEDKDREGWQRLADEAELSLLERVTR